MGLKRLLPAAAVALLLPAGAAIAASTSSPLVLATGDTPGLKPAPATLASGTKALTVALAPARLPALQAQETAAARYTFKATELWSLAFVMGDAQKATKLVNSIAASARRGGLARLRLPVGEGGWLLQRPEGKPRPVVIVWRRLAAVGVVIFRSPIGQAKNREFARSYAVSADARLRRALTQSAWQRALDQIKPDGTVPRQVALDTFALAYAPLPGSTRPGGPADPRIEGTLAARLILQQWSSLSAAQRSEAMKRLGLTKIDFSRKRKTAGVKSWWHSFGGSEYGDPKFYPSPEYTKIAKKWVGVIQTKLGQTLSYKVVAGISDNVSALADATPVDENGVLSNGATTCRIRVGPLGENAPAEVQDSFLAHEVFHCFQFDIMTPVVALSLSDRRNWLLEGSADWAEYTLSQLPWESGGSSTTTYLETPGTPLFKRTYDAVGFFGQVEVSTGPLWPRIPAILKPPTSEGNYGAAGGDEPAFLRTWAASTFNLPMAGYDWSPREPLAPPADLPLYRPFVAPQGGPVGTAEYTYRRFLIDPAAMLANDTPILHIEFSKGSNARLAADNGIDLTDLEDAWFCLRASCACPPGSEGNPPPAVPLIAKLVRLAVTGGRNGSFGIATPVSLQTYCKQKQKDPKDPPDGPPLDCKTGCATSNGDPHLTTFDGRFYNFQAAGEFTLARSTKDNLEVQVREEPYPGTPNLAINTAIGLRIAGDRVAVYRGTPLVVRVNGLGFTAGAAESKLPHGGRIRTVAKQLEATWPDGTSARLWPVEPFGVAVLLRPAEARKGGFAGLLGNYDGDDTNDFVTRQGLKLDPKGIVTSRKLLYDTFGESWRITQASSLFDYGRGQTTKSFTNRKFPLAVLTVADLPPKERARAERICKAMGIKDPRILDDCILDVAGTGDNRFATASGTLQKTTVNFGGTPSGSAGVTKWTLVSKSVNAPSSPPSLGVDGGKVVGAYLTAPGSAQAVTFTPSASADAVSPRLDTIVSDWQFLYDPILLPRAVGGLQVLLRGTHTNFSGDPLNATSLVPRTTDGKFGPPAPVTTDPRANVEGPAALAPDGVAIWGAGGGHELVLIRGTTSATIKDVSSVLPSTGTPTVTAAGRDAQGRYWLAWHQSDLGGPAGGLYLLRFDPTTLAPIGAPQRAPNSGELANQTARLAFACAATCRVLYTQGGERIVSWAFGEATPTPVYEASSVGSVAAAYTAGGRLWVAWWELAADSHFAAKLGNAAGAGGTTIAAGRPTANAFLTKLVGVTAVGDQLVMLVQWGQSGTFARYVNVIPPA